MFPLIQADMHMIANIIHFVKQSPDAKPYLPIFIGSYAL